MKIILLKILSFEKALNLYIVFLYLKYSLTFTIKRTIYKNGHYIVVIILHGWSHFVILNTLLLQ